VTAHTRRAALAAFAAVALARPASASAAASEPAVMLDLIRCEDAAAEAYEIAAAALGDALLERLARQDGQHAHALRVGLEALTVPPEHRAAHAERLHPATARLARARTRTAALTAAMALEKALQATFVEAARSLVDTGLLQTVATVLGGHAQQLATLRDAAGQPPLDEPTVSRR
jgi:hypothetical protein